MSTLYFQEINLNPSGKKRLTYTDTAINSIAIATGVTWQEAVKVLIEQCHIRSNMPKYATCITDTLKAFGFKKIKAHPFPMMIVQNAKASDRNSYILMIRHFGYLAMVPEQNDLYAIKGITAMSPDNITNCPVTEVWQLIPGTDNRSGILGARSNKFHCDESSILQVKNVNPMGRNIGDCVVRGLSGAFDCSWHDALDYLAKASDYAEPIVNTVPNIHLTLKELGLEYHKSRTKRGDYTGKEFCEKMSRTYFNGERIFAFVGPNHCAAILPVENEDGSISYKIQDTWDSSKRRIVDYWVYRPKKASPSLPVLTQKINGTIIHPVFGEGTIVKINEGKKGSVLEIDFRKRGIKRISADWFSKKGT